MALSVYFVNLLAGKKREGLAPHLLRPAGPSKNLRLRSGYMKQVLPGWPHRARTLHRGLQQNSAKMTLMDRNLCRIAPQVKPSSSEPVDRGFWSTAERTPL